MVERAPLGADVAGELAAIKQQGDGYLLKYGTGPLDKTLIEHGLVDEFRIWVVPVTAPPASGCSRTSAQSAWS